MKNQSITCAVEGDSARPQNDRGDKTRINVVLISGLFGLAAAAIMYSDAVSKGDQYLQDSLWIIMIAVVLGAVSLAVGLYLYLRPNKN